MSASTAGNDARFEANGGGRPQLSIRVVAKDQGVVVAVGGEIDIATVPQFRNALLEVQLASRIVVDLNDVTFMDSAGSNALVGAYHRVPPNAELRLIGLRPNVRKVPEITGLLALFPDEPGDLNAASSGL
jgi:anti-sigma B factor antagonist